MVLHTKYKNDEEDGFTGGAVLCFSNASFVTFLYIKADEMVSQWFMLPK